MVDHTPFLAAISPLCSKCLYQARDQDLQRPAQRIRRPPGEWGQKRLPVKLANFAMTAA
jgi:hypothetical protein